MATPSVDEQSSHTSMSFWRHGRLIIGVASVTVVLLLIMLSPTSTSASTTTVLVLMLPMFLAGLLSFLSPCTLPFLPAYFAFTFQARKQSIVLMTVAFFLGLATTLTLLGAASTALGGMLQYYRNDLTFWGGIIIIGFGIMSLLGKGFSGPTMETRPATSAVGSYLYGAMFTVGWTPCIGPILGMLFTMIWAQGLSIGQGAFLTFVYALGLGMPLILLATFFSTLGNGSRFWTIIRGKGFEVPIGRWTLYLHTTSIASGVLLIVMGWLLASGQLTTISALAQTNALTQWVEGLEYQVHQFFHLSDV